MCVRRMEKELEEYEIIPVAKLLFKVYADAAKHGQSQAECATIYRDCATDLIQFVHEASKSKKQNANGTKPSSTG